MLRLVTPLVQISLYQTQVVCHSPQGCLVEKLYAAAVVMALLPPLLPLPRRAATLPDHSQDAHLISMERSSLASGTFHEKVHQV